MKKEERIALEKKYLNLKMTIGQERWISKLIVYSCLTL